MVRRAVEELDLEAVHAGLRAERGRPPFHPKAMVGLLLYGASTPRGGCSGRAVTM
jgi:hypothetical protein